MYLLPTAALLSSLSLASLIPTARYVHEKRDVVRHDWVKLDASALNRQSILPMKIALAQNNLDRGPAWLDEVSSPESDKYGQHWTADQIWSAFAPSETTVQTVRTWLADAGIDGPRITHSGSAGFLEFHASIDEVEQLLQTEYHLFQDADDTTHTGCESYSLPQHLRNHIDFIMPTVQALPVKKVSVRRETPTAKSSPFQPERRAVARPAASTTAQCDDVTTPACLRQLYNITNGTTALVQNAIGVLELGQNYYNGTDLDLFYKNYSKAQVGQRPIFYSVDGGVEQQPASLEGSLDLQYSTVLVYPQNVSTYLVGDAIEGGTFNLFLDALDKSYCTFEGGDSPTYDPVYPDNSTGGYKGSVQCGGLPLPKVISISYGYTEYVTWPPAYMQRQCTEYMKLGMMGVSVVVASGDGGVGIYGLGPPGVCRNGTTNSTVPGNEGGRFIATFPASCPYVTAVGATQVIPGTNITAAIAKGQQPEQVCEDVIVSGGGFSDVFPIPSYQNTTVLSWFQKHKPSYTAAQYNNSMKARGFPDLSANGDAYNVVINGSFQLIYGTSASTPTVASMLTLINEERAKQNKSSVGFVNPVLYSNPAAFLNITVGSNPGCNTTGFQAVPGWNPATGLGTPSYPKLLKVFLALS